jgi:hypothetical protein
MRTGMGAGLMVIELALVLVPPGVVTVITPVVAKSDTVAVIVVASLTVKLAALSLPIFTAVAPVKLVPVIVITSPWQTVVGEKETIVGVCAPAERKVPTIKNAVLQKIRAADLIDRT